MNDTKPETATRFEKFQLVRLKESVPLPKGIGWGATRRMLPAGSTGHVRHVMENMENPQVTVCFPNANRPVLVHAHQLELAR